MENKKVNSKEDLIKVAKDLTQVMNYKTHAEQLIIPVLDNFKKENTNDPRTILLAKKDKFVEQLTSDGYIEKGQFSNRINSIIDNTKKYMKRYGCIETDNSFTYYKDYNNGTFSFRLYMCDIIIPDNDDKKIFKQLNAYFVEPKMNDFYQLSIMTGPYNLKSDEIKIGKIDLENDKVTIELDTYMKKVIDNLKYKK